MFQVIHLLRSSRAQERLARAVVMTRAARVADRLVRADSMRQLLDHLEESPHSVPVIDPYWGGALNLDDVARVVARSISAGVVAYGDFSGRPAGGDPAALYTAGVWCILTLDVDDAPESIASAIREAVGEPVIQEVLDRAAAALPWEARIVLQWALRSGRKPLGVRDLAEGVGVTPRTLRRWCSTYLGLSPRGVVAWCRLLHACRLISHADLSPASASRVMGFSSQSDLYRKYQRLVGRRLADEPKERLFGVVAEKLVRVVRGKVG